MLCVLCLDESSCSFRYSPKRLKNCFMELAIQMSYSFLHFKTASYIATQVMKLFTVVESCLSQNYCCEAEG